MKTDRLPACSYKINLALGCHSFFGEFNETQEIEYFAKGYAAWLGTLQQINAKSEAFSIFSERYIAKITALKTQGIFTEDIKLNTDIALHIKNEWKSFIDGTYGLCTVSGLPEDIAAKELAILKINELTATPVLSDVQLAELTRVVTLLDNSSAMFAPHERANSSRHRLINEVRRKYQLVT
jgi:hypothetical protein